MSAHKKNLAGGKGHKKQSNKERGGPKKNRELTCAFVEDIMEKEVIEGVMLARVIKNFGGGRAELLTTDNKTITAALKGSLKCSAGAARKSDNSIAIFPNSFVLLQSEAYGSKIIGVMNRLQVKVLEKHFPEAPRGFFNMTTVSEEEDAFDWDEAEEAVGSDGELNIDDI